MRKLLNSINGFVKKMFYKMKVRKNIKSTPQIAVPKTTAELINYLKLNHSDYLLDIRKAAKLVNDAVAIIDSNDNKEEKLEKFFKDFIGGDVSESKEEKLARFYKELLTNSNTNHLPN